jgi:hypothetical protein
VEPAALPAVEPAALPVAPRRQSLLRSRLVQRPDLLHSPDPNLVRRPGPELVPSPDLDLVLSPTWTSYEAPAPDLDLGQGRRPVFITLPESPRLHTPTTRAALTHDLLGDLLGLDHFGNGLLRVDLEIVAARLGIDIRQRRFDIQPPTVGLDDRRPGRLT